MAGEARWHRRPLDVPLKGEGKDVVLRGEAWLRNRESAQASSSSGVSGLGVLLYHPHPALGGSINNNVLDAMKREAMTWNNTVLIALVNSRGVGGSGGAVCLRGRQDAADALEVARTIVQGGAGGSMMSIPSKLIIIGYSWGTCVATRCVTELDEYVHSFIAISPPLGMAASLSLGSLGMWYILRESKVPILILHGNKDSFAGKKAVEKHTKELHKDSSIKVVFNEQADHFWIQHEGWLRAEATAWVRQLLQ